MSRVFRNLMRSLTAYQQLFDIALALVLVFAIQAGRQTVKAEQAQQDATLHAQAVVDTRAQLEEEKRRRIRTEVEITKIKRKLGAPFRLRLVCDATGSMEDELRELADAVQTIVEVLTEVGRSIEVSLIAYRDDVVVSMPMTEIYPAKKDGGASMQKLRFYLNQLRATHAYANVPLAMERVTQEGASFEGKEAILWLADQDASEAATQLNQGPQAALEQQIVERLSDWASRPNTDRRVISFFASNEGEAAPPLFKRIAAQTPGGEYHDNTMDLLSVLLKAALPSND